MEKVYEIEIFNFISLKQIKKKKKSKNKNPENSKNNVKARKILQKLEK